MQLEHHGVHRLLGERAVSLQQLLAVAAADELHHDRDMRAGSVGALPSDDARMVADLLQQL